MREFSCEECPIRGASLLAEVPAERLAHFQSFARVAIYKPRQLIFHERTPADGLYIVCHGSVKVYQTDRFGHSLILGIAEPGDVLGELPLDPKEPYASSAEALSESQLCFLERTRLLEVLHSFPSVAVQLTYALSKALSAARRKSGELALQPAENRLAKLLTMLTPPEMNGGQTVPMYSRGELAEMIGVSTETLIRLLSSLKRRGLIATHGRAISVVDRAKLTALANRTGALSDS